MTASKVYQPLETPITWKSSGGTEAWTPTSLVTAAGRQGAYHDFGTASVARYFGWRCKIKPGSTRGSLGSIIEIRLITSDGNDPDNDDGTTDLAVSTYDKLRNVLLLDTIQIDEDAAVPMVRSGYIFIPHRYAAPALWNLTGQTLSGTATDYVFSLTPVPDEGQ